MFFGLLYYLAVGGKQAGGIGIHEALIKIHCILNRMPGTNMVRGVVGGGRAGGLGAGRGVCLGGEGGGGGLGIGAPRPPSGRPLECATSATHMQDAKGWHTSAPWLDLAWQVREDNAASFLVVNAAFFTGLFTFAVFLGIVSDEVKSTFRCVCGGGGGQGPPATACSCSCTVWL